MLLTVITQPTISPLATLCNTIFNVQKPYVMPTEYTGWCTKCHTIDCAHYTFLLLQKHLTSGTELILIGWKIVPIE